MTKDCEGWCGDYCTTGMTHWVPKSHLEEPMWLCDRHFDLYKEDGHYVNA